MSTESLHRWRFLVFGILTTVAGLSLISPDESVLRNAADLGLTEFTPAGALVLVAGLIYRLTNARERFSVSFSWNEVHADIQSALLASINARRPLTPAEISFLEGDRRLVDIFYILVDNNESLKTRAEGIRFNGLIVTTLADLAIVSLLALIGHFVLAILERNPAHPFWVLGACLCWVTAEALLIPTAIANHRRRSGEQLAFIANNLSAELVQHVEKALQLLHTGANPTSAGGRSSPAP